MMKKRIPIYHYICVGMLIGALFLPWTKFDLYSGGLFSNMTLVKAGVLKAGLSYKGAYFVLICMLITSAVILAVRNLATAIIGLVLSFGLLLYMPLLGFGLTFTLFGSERNVDLQLGYYVTVLSVMSYFGFAIWNLVYIARENKKPSKVVIRNEDLLDDF